MICPVAGDWPSRSAARIAVQGTCAVATMLAVERARRGGWPRRSPRTGTMVPNSVMATVTQPRVRRQVEVQPAAGAEEARDEVGGAGAASSSAR